MKIILDTMSCIHLLFLDWEIMGKFDERTTADIRQFKLQRSWKRNQPNV